MLSQATYPPPLASPPPRRVAKQRHGGRLASDVDGGIRVGARAANRRRRTPTRAVWEDGNVTGSQGGQQNAVQQGRTTERRAASS